MSFVIWVDHSFIYNFSFRQSFGESDKLPSPSESNRVLHQKCSSGEKSTEASSVRMLWGKGWEGMGGAARGEGGGLV